VKKKTQYLVGAKKIALVGNPNVGKSSVFNILTGLNQHTGNWTGKTVDNAMGTFGKNEKYILVDTPGTYSLEYQSEEEKVTRDYLLSGEVDAILIVCDSGLVERNLYLVLQVLELGIPSIVCLNLIDEAEKHNIKIDYKLLERKLGVPVVPISARKKKGFSQLEKTLDSLETEKDKKALHIYKGREHQEELNLKASEIARATVREGNTRLFDRKLDKIFSSHIFGFPIMIALLLLVFWLTIVGANYPSELLSQLFSYIEKGFSHLLSFFHTPKVLHDALVLGVFRVLSSVVSVMLPPMAIFFPLFAILEESGVLPRFAFNLDRPFACCKACGKQALTMCMGFGCNAAGVMGCRIINSKRERLLAILTNSFVPCNGRFPSIIIITSIFWGSSALTAAIGLTSVILLGVFTTFIATYILSATLLKGEPSSYILELPSFKRPNFWRVLISSLREKTIALLIRAIKVAAPAGLIIWILANIKTGDATLLSLISTFLEPFGKLIGLDGVILMAFILGFPANEIVLPIALMGYLGLGSLSDITSVSSIGEILITNGWTHITAICFMIFSLLHFPCSTTILTIKKETGSIKWTILSAVLPTLFGITFCFLVNQISKVFL